MEEKINNMKKSEFNTLKRRAQRTSFSDFAKFCRELKGYGFVDLEKRERIYKYQLFASGYDPEKLMHDTYPEIVKFRKYDSEQMNERQVEIILNKIDM